MRGFGYRVKVNLPGFNLELELSQRLSRETVQTGDDNEVASESGIGALRT